jgi:ribosomal protein S18 acetylase RimI-like enzyme
MNKFSPKTNVSTKIRQAHRIISEEGPVWFLRRLYGYLIYHLSGKWHFVYFELPLEQEISSFQLKEPITVRIATPEDLASIKSELFPLLEGDLSNDKRYFDLMDQPATKCFLAERDGKLIHYSWVFLEALNSPLMNVPFNKSKLRSGDAYIGPIFTSPAVRGFIYLQVLSTILHYLKDNSGGERALLLVDGRRRSAVSFYKRLGFTEIVGAQPTGILPYLWQRLTRDSKVSRQ